MIPRVLVLIGLFACASSTASEAENKQAMSEELREFIKKYNTAIDKQNSADMEDAPLILEDTALILACRHDRIDLVRELIHLGVKLNTLDSVLCTALVNAVDKNNCAIVKELLKNGADYTIESGISFFNENSDDVFLEAATALTLAKKRGYNDIAQAIESHPIKVRTLVHNELSQASYQLPNGVINIVNSYLN